MRAIRLAFLCTLALIAVAHTVHAGAIYNFDVTFNGVSPSVDASSDPISGTNLLVGDSFNLDIHAAGNDFWKVTGNISSFLEATFVISQGAVRTGNAITTFYLDGVQVNQINELGITEQSVHMGNQIFNVASGLQFDQLVVDFQLLGSTNPSGNTIASSPDIIAFSPFFRDSNISYVHSVPEPTSLTLFAFGGLGVVALRRRQRTAN